MARVEAELEDAVVAAALNTLGVRSIKLNLRGNTGWPDRLFFIPGGRPLLIEFKAPGLALEPRQTLIQEFLLYNDYNHQAHDNKARALEAIRAAVDAAHRAGWRRP